MKKIIIIFIAVLIGCGISYYIFNVREDDDVLVNNDIVLVKGFQIGYYSNYDNALKQADRYNGIVINDADMFRVYIAILRNENAISKISNYYDSIGLNYYIKDIYVSSSFVNSISSSEELIVSNNLDNYNTILFDILKIYEEYL